MGSEHSNLDLGPAAFPVTRWSMVDGVAEGDSDAKAKQLERFCQDYWYPLYAFARRQGQSAEDAKDLTQHFFSLLVEKDWLASADREKGRLRTFLLTAFRRVMMNESRHQRAKGRGGQVTMFSWEQDHAESRYAATQSDLPAEEVFDRQWALLLMERTLDRLKVEFEHAGKGPHFERLKESLMAERGDIDYAALAGPLDMNEGAVRVAVHRLRKRFRLLFREEVERTLAEGEDVNEEMHYLARVLA